MTLLQRARAVRAFNRFYTRQIGLLHRGYLESPFSLTEMRVLYELAHRDRPTARELSQELDLDAGYLSRLLRNFERLGYVTRAASPTDARQSELSLTPAGHKVFAPFEAKADAGIAAMLERLPVANQVRLIEAMGVIEKLLRD